MPLGKIGGTSPRNIKNGINVQLDLFALSQQVVVDRPDLSVKPMDESKEIELKRRDVLKRGAVATGALVVGGTAMSGSALAQSGGKATGGVNYTTGCADPSDAHASFTAQDGPQGPKGRVTVKNHDGVDFKGEVTCYHQDGNFARFSGPITQSSGENKACNDQGTGYYRIEVEDNGEPSDDSSNPDKITVFRSSESLDCTNGFGANRPIESGNLQVHQP